MQKNSPPPELIIHDFEIYMVDVAATMEKRCKSGAEMPRNGRVVDRTISHCKYSVFKGGKFHCFKDENEQVCRLGYQRDCENWEQRLI